MARKKRSVLWADANAKFTGSGNKWEGQELDDTIEDIKDSAAFEDEPETMTTNTYDCSTGNFRVRTLSGNGTLTVTGGEQGRYYTLIKTNGFTLTLPTGHFSASGSTTGTGRTVITFMFDGTNYHFSFSTYSAT